TSQTIGINQSVYVNSTDEYLAGADDPDISPSNAVTLQAWIYPLSTNDGIIIHKGPPAGGASTNYRLNITNKKLAAMINGTAFSSTDTIPAGQWTHIAFTYSYNSSIFLGFYNFYVNGKRINGGTGFGVGNIQDGSDSLYIGGSIGQSDFNGYIDEVRISSRAMNETELNDSLYVPMENSSNLPGVTIAYCFDGYTYCSSLRGPHLYFRNACLFTTPNSPYPVSPLNKGTTLPFFQKGYYIKSTDRRIPETGSVGYMTEDSLEVFLDENITDINFFVAFNHDNTQELELFLKSPGGTILQILNSNNLVQQGDNIITVFDDQSVNDLSNGLYATFSPSIKPLNNLNLFNGSGSKGIWKILIHDYAGTGIGRLYSWGLQFNYKTVLPKLLQCNAFIQGFYNSPTDNMNRDTLRSYLRNSASPFAIIDSSKVYIQPDGSGVFKFTSSSVLKGIKYYQEIKHRNSIETWSNATGVMFQQLTFQAAYDFTSDSTKAFGNNIVKIDNSPLRFAIYSADVNQDGFVNLNDIIIISNDASSFVTGYVKSDVTGDNVANLADIVLAYNNSNNFVSVIRP
ncbi:MAG: LamG-like jellyroll fold domain-containing protein, partial [Ignavibacteria bacterium]